MNKLQYNKFSVKHFRYINVAEIFVLIVQMRKSFVEPVDLRPGEKVGQFSLGSSIVLLFEAPRGLQFPHPPLHKIRYGEHLL
jgi:hypothetical protein